MIKGYVGSSEKDIKKVPMLINGVDKGWEVRDQQGRIIWGALRQFEGSEYIVFRGYGLPVDSYQFFGNMYKSPNLYDKDRTYDVMDGKYINKNTQAITSLRTYELSYPIPVTPGKTYWWTFNESDGQIHSAPTIGYYNSSDELIGAASHTNNITVFSFTPPSGCVYVRASVFKSAKNQAMLTESAPTSYEEYGIIETCYKNFQLYDKDVLGIFNAQIDQDGYWVSNNSASCVKIPVEPNQKYTLSIPESANAIFRISEHSDFNVTPGTGQTVKLDTSVCRSTNMSSYTFTTQSTTHCIIFQGANSSVNAWNNGLMLNTGSYPHTYQSYAYYIHADTIYYSPYNSEIYSITLKEPIRKMDCPEYDTTYSDILSSNGSITRRIRKYIFNGTENFSAMGDDCVALKFQSSDAQLQYSSYMCTHYQYSDDDYTISPMNTITSRGDDGYSIIFKTRYGSNVEAFKAYLKDQYGHGSPVTIWYILNTAKTETITTPVFQIKNQNVEFYIMASELQPSNVVFHVHGRPIPLKTLTGTDSIPFIGFGSDLTEVTIEGNMTYSGIPSVDNVIKPLEVGAHTTNLWNNLGFSAKNITMVSPMTRYDTNTYGTTISSTTGGTVEITQTGDGHSTYGSQNGFFFIAADPSEFVAGESYTLMFDYEVTNGQCTASGNPWVYAFNGSSYSVSSLSSGDWNTSGTLYMSFVMPDTIETPSFEIRLGGNSINVSNIRIVKGELQQTVPYEPYGFIIPITYDDTTYNVSVSAPLRLLDTDYRKADTISIDNTCTRKINKIVFNGTEGWYQFNGVWYISNVTDYLKEAKVTAFCSHYPVQANVGGTGDVESGKMCFGTNASLMRLFIKDTTITTLSDWIVFLARQYSNGTPVTVWYMLAEDVVESISLPSFDAGHGENEISVDTELAPSLLRITGYIEKYIDGYVLKDSDGSIIKDADGYIIKVEE